jgi:HSP20 family protein
MANMIRRNEVQRQMMPMSTGTDWEPLRLMRELLNWDPFAEMSPSATTEGMVFSPRFEVKETEDAYVFKGDLPGIDEKDVEISLTGNRLTVSGRREVEEREENERFYAYERSYGAFSRSFTLPEGADVEHAEAEMKNGVLTIKLPKRPEHQPRKISLKTLGEKVKGALGVGDKGKA